MRLVSMFEVRQGRRRLLALCCERRHGQTVLLAPCKGKLADGDVGVEDFVFERLVCVGGGVVGLEPVLDVVSVVRVPVRRNHRVFHQPSNAMSHSSSAQQRVT